MTKTFKSILFVLYFSIFILQFATGCKKDLTPVDNTIPEIKLTVEDVGVTEVWLRLETADGKPEDRITILRNDSTIQSRITGHSALDTLIYDSELLPNHDYTYTATLLTSNQNPVTSIQQLTTMDTTNHDFTWQSWTFGAKGSSILYDVAIIDENNIWCVGEIYTEDTYTYDSLGNWIEPYNVVHWDGSEWELMRYKRYLSYFTEPHWFRIDGIYAFSENDIWLAKGIVHHYDSTYYSQHGYVKSCDLWDMGVLDSTDGGIKKLWGSSPTDLYGVGDKGTIVHFNGQTWQRIESGVNENINDIWGVSENESHYILATVSNKYSTGDTKLLKINEDNTVSDENWSISTRDPYSIWFMNSQRLFVCGAGIFTRNLNNQWHEFAEVPLIYTNRIRGNSINDIFVAGDSGIITHYNGISWKIFDEAAIALFRSLDFKNDIVVAVGGANPIATILMGQRQ